MSRACGLVSPLARIYIPKFISGSPIDPDSKIAWENVDMESSKLDPITFREVCLTTDENKSIPIYNSHLTSNGETSEYFLAITGEVFSWMLDFASEETIQRVYLRYF